MKLISEQKKLNNKLLSGMIGNTNMISEMKNDGITVNVWDDYKQKPEYDMNDDTFIEVEEYDFPLSLVDSITEVIYEYIQDNIEIDGVSFEMSSKERTDYEDETYHKKRIVVKNMGRESRGELLDALRKGDLKIMDTEIDFISES